MTLGVRLLYIMQLCENSVIQQYSIFQLADRTSNLIDGRSIL